MTITNELWSNGQCLCMRCVDYGFCLIIELHTEDHKLITPIRITYKLTVNRANGVRGFKSEFIFIWINSFTSESNSNWIKWKSLRVHLNAIASMIIYFLPFNDVRDSVVFFIDQTFARTLFVCFLDQFICIGLLILIIDRINVLFVVVRLYLLPFQKQKVQETCVGAQMSCSSGFLRLFSFVLLKEQRINNIIQIMPHKMFGFAIKFKRPTALPLSEVKCVRESI